MKVRTYGGIAFWTVALVLAVVLGSHSGTRVQARAQAAEDSDQLLKTFSSVLSLVEQNHATEIDRESAVYGGIAGLLRTLDPHSRFFAPSEFEQLREDQSGTYYGLGITVSSRFGKVTVVSPPFSGAPAEKVGLRVGDVISHVNGVPTEGDNLTTVVNRLKGPKGTPVNITIVRPGVPEPFDREVIRDEISKFTISQKFEIREGVGFIRVDSFAETTGAELRQAMTELDVTNLDGLILDLRGNPGGLLQQAIEVSEAFLLERGQLIVETRGRVRNSDRDYISTRTNADGPYPLVVLIDRSSASASEIVAGAIQDHDRGLIVGETSFGKGLVQSVYPLSRNGGGLALTTQKWYTPSGRLIQRDYSALSEFDYYNTRDESGPAREDIHFSDLGREVYGGGGITPDHIEPRPSGDFIGRFPHMSPPFAFYTFAQEFLEDQPGVTTAFEVTDELFRAFLEHVRGRGITISDQEAQENRSYIAQEIRFEVLYYVFGVSEAQKSLLEQDVQVLRALEVLPDAAELVQRAASALTSAD